MASVRATVAAFDDGARMRDHPPGRSRVLRLPAVRGKAEPTRCRGRDDARSTPRVNAVPHDTIPCPPPVDAVPSPRVLIVDDVERLARAVQRVFRDCDVVVCTNAQQALDRIAGGERFDVIFSDVDMPGMTGCELYEAIVREAPEQAERFVFVTGDSSGVRTKVAPATYGRPVLEKPVKPEVLRALAKRFVA